MSTIAPRPLADLLGDTEWTSLERAFWEKRPVIQATTVRAGRFDPLWAEWELDAICRFTPVPLYEEFRLLSRSKTIPRSAYTDRLGKFREDALRQLRAGGASVALGNFSGYSDLALALTRQFEAEFRCPVQINLYITPPHQQGLGSHVDPHDVLIFQLRGAKSWDIYEGADAGGTITRAVLDPGGWLYLPKGRRHEVRNHGADTSVHFTIGFHPLTWGEVFSRALAEARVAGRSLNDAIPPTGEVADTPAQMLERMQAILAEANVSRAREKYYADFPNLAVEIPAGSFLDRARIEAIGPDTVLQWCGDATLRSTAGAPCEITRSYRRFALPLRHEYKDALLQLQSAGRFSPRHVPGTVPEEGLMLCRFLALNGMVGVATSG